MKELAVIIGVTIFFVCVAGESGCWSRTYGRGVGKPLSTCPDDKDKNGLLCYPKCKEGYYGVGPVCWQRCPTGFKDIGVGCQKPAPYGRGAGHFTKGKCQKKADSCERWGLLWYPKCKSNFHNVACCICSPDCPNGLIDSGVTCTKRSYGRTAGKPMICAPGLENNAALCYKKCADGYKGIGPVCWKQCPSNFKSCGALCLPSSSACGQKMTKIAQEVGEAAAEIAVDPAGAASALAKAVAGIGTELIYPVC